MTYLHPDTVLLYKKLPIGTTYFELNRPPLKKMTTASGLEVYVPLRMRDIKIFNLKTGELINTVHMRDPCAWDAPLPSTPHLDRRLRTPGDLSSGFLISPPAP